MIPLIPVWAPPALAPLSQSVLGPPAVVDWLTVMLFEPAKTQSIPVDRPVLPAVLPVLDAPSPLIADWLVWAAVVTLKRKLPFVQPPEMLFEKTSESDRA